MCAVRANDDCTQCVKNHKLNKRSDVYKSEIIDQAKPQGAKQGSRIIVTRLWSVMCRMIAMR